MKTAAFPHSNGCLLKLVQEVVGHRTSEDSSYTRWSTTTGFDIRDPVSSALRTARGLEDLTELSVDICK